MHPISIAEVARRQLADYDAHRPGGIFADPSFTLTVAEAYAVQGQVAALRAARGEAVAGYKIGCISDAVQKQLGLNQPAFGRVFATDLHPSGVVLAASAFEGLAIEGEIAVRLGAGLAVASIFPVIELHNYVFRRGAPTAEELIANNALHAGVVLPQHEAQPPDASEVSAETLSVFRNGERLGAARTDSIPGGPLASLAKVAEYVDSLGTPLEAGQIILTGSPLPLYPARPGDHIVVRGPRATEVELFIGA